MVLLMSTSYFPVRVDTRGSLNLPSSIRNDLRLDVGTSVLVREINGVVLLVPFHGASEQASSDGKLQEWVDERLGHAMAPASITPSKTAVAESIKMQAMRERLAGRKAILELELRVAEARAAERAEARRAARIPAPSTESVEDIVRGMGGTGHSRE